MIKLFKKYRVTLLDNNWKVLNENLKWDSIPRISELIYFKGENKYYQVVNIVHDADDNNSKFIVIEEYVENFEARMKGGTK